ncbi:hypothetical protein [Uliginosibacterium sp. H1]|uniref:hypothetical protein n=1 Tax=Uliginosibacterium sp. H1 TaxID=3114757 RepID=UPI002E19E5BF|nr:hypothetical protein [Uliginosibacterium sp. H1]
MKLKRKHFAPHNLPAAEQDLLSDGPGALSLVAQPKPSSVAVVVEHGVAYEVIESIVRRLGRAARVFILSERVGAVRSAEGNLIEVDGTVRRMDARMFDYVIAPCRLSASLTRAFLEQAREAGCRVLSTAAVPA